MYTIADLANEKTRKVPGCIGSNGEQINRDTLARQRAHVHRRRRVPSVSIDHVRRSLQSRSRTIRHKNLQRPSSESSRSAFETLSYEKYALRPVDLFFLPYSTCDPINLSWMRNPSKGERHHTVRFMPLRRVQPTSRWCTRSSGIQMLYSEFCIQCDRLLYDFNSWKAFLNSDSLHVFRIWCTHSYKRSLRDLKLKLSSRRSERVGRYMFMSRLEKV